MESVDGSLDVEITLSVVSHLQIGLIESLLNDINQHASKGRLELILTLNLEEVLPFVVSDFSFPIRTIQNVKPLGFGANHNQAFKHARGHYFCVMNPDIRLNGDPFHALIASLGDPLVGVAAPVVLGLDGFVEDSARRFPSPLKILLKALGVGRGSDYVFDQNSVFPDWVGGMFMLFPSTVFEKLSGFDESFFLYYEDVDLCGRLKLLGFKAVVCPQVTVVHHARRSSHRDLKYLRWHIASMVRFFLSSVYLRLQWRKLVRNT